MIEIKVLASSSKGNCYRATDGRTPLLLDCGIPFQEIRKGLDFQTAEIEGCLITHEHQDHIKGAAEAMRAGIDCYMTIGTASENGSSGCRTKVIEALQQFQLGTWTVIPFDTQHDAAEPVGFLLANQAGEKLLYATDTYYIRYRFNGLTHIMIECNHSRDILHDNIASGALPLPLKKRLIRSHFSLENVKEFLKANDLSRVEVIYLIHLSDGNSDEKRFKREIQELTGKMVIVAQA